MKKLNIYNTLTRKKEPFIPFIDEGKKKFVGIYSCWPTVYRDPHIGNMRAFSLADNLRSVIRWLLGYPLIHVMNITDVWHLVWDGDIGEDKLEKWARRENTTAWIVAEMYEKLFMETLQKLHIDKFDVMPKATDHINEQIEIIIELERKWYTYTIPNDGIYMDSSLVKDYGKLMWTNYKEFLAGLKEWARVDVKGKKNATDFALWKFSSIWEKRHMERDSPWWIWFPWWHIECTAMSRKYLGDNFDIHTWWYDHITVHHTNEIAQSECGFTKDKPWVKYWMHCQFLNMEWGKVSKTWWKFISFEKIFEQWYFGVDVRMFFFMSHYRNFQDLTWVNLDNAKNMRNSLIKKISILFRQVEANVDLWQDFKDIRNYEQFESRFIKSEFWQLIFDEIIDCILDDLDMSALFTVLNKAITECKWSIEILDIINILRYLDEKIFKLDLIKDMIFNLNKEDIKIPELIINIAEKRKIARNKKDFQEADRLRDEILSKGYDIKDTKDGYELILK